MSRFRGRLAQRNRAARTKGGSWWKSAKYVADNQNPAFIADLRNNRYMKPKLLSDSKNGTPAILGSATAATFNNSTGAGSVTRVDINNQSYLTVTAGANKVYAIDVSVSSGGLLIRQGTGLPSGAIIGNIAAGNRTTLYLIPTGSGISYTSTDAATTSFTIHSMREVDTAQMEVAQFADLYTFARAGTATYIDQNGVMQIAANDVPRFDYSNGVRQPLLEGSITNLATYSDDFSNATGWPSSAAYTVGGFPDPFGGNTAAEFTAPNSTIPIFKQISSGGRSAGIAGRFYFYSTENFAWTFLVRNNTTLTNLNTRTLNVSTYASNPIGFTDTSNGWTFKYIGGNWVEVSFVQLTNMTDNDSMIIYYGMTGANNNGRKCRLAKFDFFPEPKVSSHIVTTASAVTRAADNCRLSPMAEAVLQRTDASVIVQGKLQNIVAGGANQTILGGISAGGVPALILAQGQTATNIGTWNGTNALWTTSGLTNLSAAPFGSGMSFNASGRTAVLNGGSAANDNFAAGDRSQIYLGRTAGSIFGSGWYDQMVIWPFRMTDAALQGKAVAYV